MQTIFPFSFLIGSAIMLSSCINPKKSDNSNPYGDPIQELPQIGGNPYSVPEAYDTTPPQSYPEPIPSAQANAPYIPAQTTSTSAPTASQHVVVSGDSLWGLSKKYNTTVAAIQTANNLTGTVIKVGQSLVIPAH